MENFGTGPAVVYGAAHGSGYCGGGGISGSLDTGSPLAGDFHVYAVRWAPDRIDWYFDDARYHTVTRAGVNGNRWVFDQAMLIDYVRVYAG